MTKTLFDKREELKDNICQMIMQRESDPLSQVKNLEHHKNTLQQDLTFNTMILESARKSQKVMREIHEKIMKDKQTAAENSKDRLHMFEEMKKDYAERVTASASLMINKRGVERDLRNVKNEVAKLREELAMITGDSPIERGDNPWNLGVGYGGRRRRDGDHHSSGGDYRRRDRDHHSSGGGDHWRRDRDHYASGGGDHRRRNKGNFNFNFNKNQ